MDLLDNCLDERVAHDRRPCRVHERTSLHPILVLSSLSDEEAQIQDVTASSSDGAVANTASMHSITLLPTVLAFNVWISSSQAQYNTTYGTIQPVLSVDFADPSIIEVNGNWFAFATSGNGHNIQVAVSPGFTNHEWRLMNETDVLPDPGRWAINDQRVWAPDVIQTVGELGDMNRTSKLTSIVGRR